MKEKKEAKFFCESCGSEVPKNAKFCPVCGKFFASVRCPQCGKIGSVSEFKNGCTVCGYAMHPSSNINSKKDLKSNYDEIKAKKNDSSLPVWIYVCTFFVLIILVIILYSCLK